MLPGGGGKSRGGEKGQHTEEFYQGGGSGNELCSAYSLMVTQHTTICRAETVHPH